MSTLAAMNVTTIVCVFAFAFMVHRLGLCIMLHLFWRKMIYVKKYFSTKLFLEKMIFWKYFVFGSHEKNYKRRKMQLSSESGNVWSPLSDSGEHVWPDSSGSSQIQPDPGHFGQIWLASDHGWIPASFAWNLVRWQPATVAGCRQISASAVFWWPDVVGFRCRLKFDDRQLLDSDNQISNERAKTKSLIF
jgi:hypothetical protein